MTAREPLFLACDLGTSSVKAVVTGPRGEVRGAGHGSYATHRPAPGWVEQDPEDWWRSLVGAARDALRSAGADVDAVAGIAFSGQMQGTLPVDSSGRPLSRCLIWLDARAVAEAREVTRGFVRYQGYGVWRLLTWLRLTNGAPSLTGKDPAAKLLWIRKHQPELFERAARFLDAKDYLVWRATGRQTTSVDCAHLTWLMDARPGRRCWSPALLARVGVARHQMPEILACDAVVGGLAEDAAGALGLRPGTPVVAGAGDLTAMALGAGAVGDGQLHLGLGTSSWITAHVRGRRLDSSSYVASVTSARPDREIVVATQECAGACVDWLARLLALEHGALDVLAAGAEPGAGSLLFLPWLAGERVPIDDPLARGGFLNASLEHGPAQLARAVYEGVAFNTRWALERVDRLLANGGTAELRLAGGGARLAGLCQVLADVLGRELVQLSHPELAAARGAALLAAKATGHLQGFDEIASLVPESARYRPRSAGRARYDSLFRCFTSAYRSNRRLFARLNG